MRNYTVSCALLLALILAMCQAESRSARLTAFGKTPNQGQNTNPKKNVLGYARDCNDETDCHSIQNTTCLNDPRDNKKRCLCRDSSAPVNGACPNIPRAVRANCHHDAECVERAECRIQPNSTITTKMCLCKEGFEEHEGWCSGAFRISLPSVAVVIATSVFTILIAERRHTSH